MKAPFLGLAEMDDVAVVFLVMTQAAQNQEAVPQPDAEPDTAGDKRQAGGATQANSRAQMSGNELEAPVAVTDGNGSTIQIRHCAQQFDEVRIRYADHHRQIAEVA